MRLVVKSIKDIIPYHTGAESEFTIEQRLFNVVGFFGGLIGFGAAIINLFIDAAPEITIPAAAVALFCWGIFYLSRFRKKFETGRWILTIFAFIMFGYFFFVNNGSYGPMLQLYMAFFLLMLFVWNGKARVFFVVVFILNITAFFLIELRYPGIVDPYTNEQTRLMDIYLSYYMYIALVGVILLFAKNSYIREKKKAEQSDHLKSAFLANMSHEIRTPMNAILGFTHLLYRDLTKEKRESYLKVIDENSHSLLRLIEDIIDVSKIEAGELSFRDSDFDVSALIAELAGSFREALGGGGDKRIRIIELHPEQTLRVRNDRTRLRQVLVNLVSNAVKNTENGKIEIGCRRDSDILRFWVRDTGRGIREEHLEEIFDRFRKIESEDAYKFQSGTGIGLSISRNLVKMMGGEIGVESTYGEGAEFYFTIPYRPAPEEVMEEEKQVQVKKIFGAPDLTGKKVMVAEDDLTNFEFLKKVMERSGAEVMHARNGLEAVQLATGQHVDLILMDIMMPEMNGYDATRKIREDQPGISIIAQTALAMEGDHQRAIDAGCDDYISKPIRITELWSKIERLKQ